MEAGNDIDAAINRLKELHLEYEAGVSAEGEINIEEGMPLQFSLY